MNILLFSKQINNNTTAAPFLREGFLLLELMVSITLFIFFLHLLHIYTARIHDLSYEAVKRYNALMVLESFIIDAQKNSSLLKQKNYHKEGYEISWTDQPFPLQQSGFLRQASHCSYYTFSIAWTGLNKKKHTIHLATGVIS